MAYERQHATALRMLKAKGAAVTFSKSLPGTHDAATDTYTSPSVSEVAGYAVEVRPKSAADIEKYRALSLVPAQAPTLEFAAETFGAAPELGATASWAGHTVTVRDIVGVQPGGTPILFRLVVSR